MCLTITIEPFGGDAAALSEIAASMPARLLRFHYEGRFRPGRRTPRLRMACACELLAESADWDAATHDMTPDGEGRLAETLTWLTTRYPAPLAVEVVWDGEAIEAEEALSAAELVALVRSSEVGTKTRYLVSPDEQGEATP